MVGSLGHTCWLFGLLVSPHRLVVWSTQPVSQVDHLVGRLVHTDWLVGWLVHTYWYNEKHMQSNKYYSDLFSGL